MPSLSESSTASKLALKLVNGTNRAHGRLEAYNDTLNICHSVVRSTESGSITRMKLAKLACRKLGFTRGVPDYGISTGLTSVLRVKTCPSNATDLDDCETDFVNDQAETVSLLCLNEGN